MVIFFELVLINYCTWLAGRMRIGMVAELGLDIGVRSQYSCRIWIPYKLYSLKSDIR
jgi:hypothetical protein